MSNFEQETDEPFSHMELDDFLRSEFDREFEVNENPTVELRISNSAFGNRVREFDLVNSGYIHIEEFLANTFELFERQIDEALNRFKMIKTVCYLSADFERAFVSDDQSDPLFEKRLIYIPTKVKEINTSTNLSEYFQTDVIDYVKRKVDEVLVEGSGFTLSKIEKLTVQIFKYEPLQGSGDIELPKILKNKHAIINLKIHVRNASSGQFWLLYIMMKCVQEIRIR